MTANINVDNADNTIIAGRDVVINQLPNKSGSVENIDHLGKSSFWLSAVNISAVCGMIYNSGSKPGAGRSTQGAPVNIQGGVSP